MRIPFLFHVSLLHIAELNGMVTAIGAVRLSLVTAEPLGHCLLPGPLSLDEWPLKFDCLSNTENVLKYFMYLTIWWPSPSIVTRCAADLPAPLSRLTKRSK